MRIDHTGITVRNLEKSVDFYTNIMGFKLVDPPGDMITDKEESKALGVPECVHRICMLEVGENQFVELMEFGDVDSPNEQTLPLNQIGQHHMSYLVDDIDEWIDKLKKENIQFIYKKLPYGSSWWVMFKDPDGIIVELMEVN